MFIFFLFFVFEIKAQGIESFPGILKQDQSKTLVNQENFQEDFSEIQPKSNEKKINPQYESQIFQYIRTSQGVVKSRYHQGGIFFDVDPD
jgi:hypothetical protein